jgi:hypothetical protein
LLVEPQPRSPTLGGKGVARDLLAKRRVLATVAVAEDEARVSGLGPEALQLRHPDDCLRHR